MKELKLSKRLSAAAEYCRHGSFIADVGTDHAYLPIYLAKKGYIRGGVVSDINKGPIDRARAHIAEAGLEKLLSPVLCDGLSSLESYSPEDVFILGMGGELIARIISDAPMLERKGVRLILQPMTHPEILRAYLSQKGFEIIAETIIRDDKLYQLICAEYTGVSYELTPFELTFGKLNIEGRSELLFELFDHTKKVMDHRIRGKALSGADTSEEEYFLKEIKAIYDRK